MFLGFAAQTYAAAFTSKTTGNWSSTGQTTWNEPGVPGTGDTVTISNGHTITVNSNVSVGATVVGGRLTLGAYTLTMEGALTIGNGASKDGTLTFGAGSTLSLGANALALNNCFLTSTATSGSWAKVTGTGAITNGGVYTAPKQDIMLSYVSFQNSGAITFAIGGTNGTGETNRFVATNCTFSGGGLIIIGTAGWTPTSSPTTITYCDFRTSGTDTDYITIYGSTTSNYFSNNTVQGAERASLRLMSNAWTISNNVFVGAGIGVVNIGAGGSHTITNNYLALASTANSGSAVVTAPGNKSPVTFSGNYIYLDYANPHVWDYQGLTGNTAEWTFADSVFEVVFNSDGVNFFAPREATTNITGNILIGSGTLAYSSGAKTLTAWNIEHNTMLVKETNAEAYGVLYGLETSGAITGDVNVRSNIMAYAAGVTPSVNSRGCSDISASQPSAIATGDYNDWSNVGTDYYQISVIGGSAHDIDTDPQFIDETRSLATWNAAEGSGTGTKVAAEAYLLAINGYNSTTKTQSDTPSAKSPSDLVAWVRDGFKVQNAALNNAGHDGATIGAMDYYTPPTVGGVINLPILAYFDINVSSGQNGSISPSKLSISQGSTVNLSIVPDSGYQISNVIVDGVSVGAVSNYQFNYISSSHTISAVFSKIESSLSSNSSSSIVPKNLTKLGELVALIEKLKLQIASLQQQGFPSAIFVTPLFKGLQSDDVSRLQKLLATKSEIYPEGKITGYFGILTEKAVQQFQLQYKIVKSQTDPGFGYVGPKTRTKLKEVFGK